MGFLNELGSLAGKVTGKVIGGSVRVVGEITNSQTIKEIGDGAERATAKTGELLGKVASGTVDVGIGLFQKDEHKVNQGFSELGDAVVTTAKGVGQGIGYVYENGKNVAVGIKDGNMDQVKEGAKKIGMVAAVSVLAVGIFEVVDGVDGVGGVADAAEAPTDVDTVNADAPTDVQVIDTINSDLVGTEHPETGVPYETKTIQLTDGQWVEGVFPDFNEVYAYELPESMYLQTDDVQFSYLNDQLANDIANDPALAATFTADQMEDIHNGDTPEGYVWHHTEEPGRMELVEVEEHAHSAHTGGRELWGGGSEYR
ncbi:HNH endonuclease [Paenibacillus soyae]|uniref:HNH endonuclease n=1 Tax=Paenibacillus soyae TaxID=2969249 RepID=A0A9X2S6J1_9BACL|nr:HNH endonuclease [Paenibacillus soyae]MCR2802294.1 HNH endonuclease [Paenibacillus soyae]